MNANLVTLFGRILFSGIFLLSGLSKFGDFPSGVATLHAKGVPFADAALFIAGVIEIAGAVTLITGFKHKLGALVLAIYLIPVTFVFHFDLADKLQIAAMLKNLSIIGALLLVSKVGIGAWTIGKD